MRVDRQHPLTWVVTLELMDEGNVVEAISSAMPAASQLFRT